MLEYLLLMKQELMLSALIFLLLIIFLASNNLVAETLIKWINVLLLVNFLLGFWGNSSGSLFGNMYHTNALIVLQKNLLNHTTGDILLIHNQIATDKEMLSELAGILRTNDAVKFAKYIPPKYESEKTKEQLKNILTSIEKHFKNLKTTTS